MHPKPEDEEEIIPKSASPNHVEGTGEVPVENLIQLDTDDDIIFEDFARLRLKGDGDT